MGLRAKKPSFNNRYGGLEFRVCLVRENRNPQAISINGPEDAYRLVRRELESADREIFLSILLTVKNTVIGVETISIGSVHAAFVTGREIFKGAILANASGIILCHNHPSGSINPSEEDTRLTEKLVTAGEFLDIRIVDHLIVGHGKYQSIMHE